MRRTSSSLIASSVAWPYLAGPTVGPERHTSVTRLPCSTTPDVGEARRTREYSGDGALQAVVYRAERNTHPPTQQPLPKGPYPDPVMTLMALPRFPPSPVTGHTDRHSPDGSSIR